MKSLDTSDYRGVSGLNWPGSTDDEEDGYPLCVSVPSLLLFTCCGKVKNDLLTGFYHVYSPLVMKVRSRAGSVMSGASTPGGGAFRNLSEGDLQKADEALSHVNGEVDGKP